MERCGRIEKWNGEEGCGDIRQRGKNRSNRQLGWRGVDRWDGQQGGVKRNEEMKWDGIKRLDRVLGDRMQRDRKLGWAD